MTAVVRKSLLLILRDAKGRARLIMKVTPEGSASIEFLDEAGKVVNRIAE